MNRQQLSIVKSLVLALVANIHIGSVLAVGIPYREVKLQWKVIVIPNGYSRILNVRQEQPDCFRIPKTATSSWTVGRVSRTFKTVVPEPCSIPPTSNATGPQAWTVWMAGLLEDLRHNKHRKHRPYSRTRTFSLYNSRHSIGPLRHPANRIRHPVPMATGCAKIMRIALKRSTIVTEPWTVRTTPMNGTVGANRDDGWNLEAMVWIVVAMY